MMAQDCKLIVYNAGATPAKNVVSPNSVVHGKASTSR